MRVVGRLIAVLALGVAALVGAALLATALGGDSAWLLVLVLASPLIGTLVGGWLVSLRSSGAGRLGWILGGGVGVAAVIYVGLIVLLLAVIASGLSGDHNGCCSLVVPA